MPAGRFLEDFKVGDVYRSPAGRTITQADNTHFSLLTNNANPIHTDAHYAAQTEFGRPLVNSFLTMAVVAGLMAPDTSQNGFALGVEEASFPEPLFDGDTLYADTEILDVRTSRSRPGWGIVKARERGRGHHRGGQPFGSERCRGPRPDVHDGDTPPSWQRGAKAQVLTAARERRPSAPSVRRDRARGGFGNDPDQDDRGQERRPVRHQWQEGLHLARAALRSHAPPRTHHALRRARRQDERAVGLPHRPQARGEGRQDPHQADRHDAQPSHHGTL